MYELLVKSVEFISDSIFEISFERDGIAFEAGNCFSLFNSTNSLRPYSVASGTDDDELRFVIRKMPNGEVSPWLSKRVSGDKVQASQPFGWFRPGQSDVSEKSVFLATGTGIAPFLAFLNSPRSSQSNIRCLYGVRHEADAVRLDFLKEKTNLSLTVSRDTDTAYHHGRITDILDGLELNEETHYYLCGLDAMIDESSEWLEKQGVDFTQIHQEVFFHAS
ncbi:MAG: hypothetical protein HRT89_01980 [Lentisphaeria bacterium]|nr:FAD-binding oxidoreductase [Lentisphaeria bacterium]NQZ66816.1 hypothetical protein [Lentisphaeria bacterium]